jgi:N-acylneuraminate cytidylyltransferase
VSGEGRRRGPKVKQERAGVNILALIPARGGSKSVPRKNVRMLAGHPLIAYSIAAGLAAERVGRLVVSTDDEEIADIARRYGADVPFLRPAPLAQDDTPDLPVFQHALDWLLENENYLPELVVQLRPTSPLRPAQLVDQGIEILLAEPLADSARAVVPSGQNPYKMWREAEDGTIAPLLEDDFHEAFNMPRQLLPRTFWQTGHLDIVRRETILRKKSMTGTRVLPIPVAPEYAVDIDSPRDLERAEALIQEGRLALVLPKLGPGDR